MSTTNNQHPQFAALQSSSQFNTLPTVISQFLHTAQQSLLHVITSLQSDQLLEQMRNDSNLYQQKMNYINQIIKHHFVIQPLNTMLIQQIQSLKKTNQDLENRLQESKQEYISELSNIEVQYNQFLTEKQNEKRIMENMIQEKNHQVFILNKDFNIKIKDHQGKLEDMAKNLQTTKKILAETKAELEENKKQNLFMKKEITTLKEINSQKQLELQQMEQTKAKSSHLSSQFSALHQQNTQLNSKIQELQQFLKQSAQNQQTYIQTIEQMKQDMFLIKDEWEKRCEQVQNQLGQDYRTKLIAHEEEMNERFKLYVEEIKMGKNVIIESSQQILETKKQLMQERFNVEIKRFQQDIAELENQLMQQKTINKDLGVQLRTLTQKLLAKEKELIESKDHYEGEIKTRDSLMKSKQEQLENKLAQTKQQTDKQIQRLRKTQNMLLKDLKASKQQKQEILKQVYALKEEFANYKQKQLKETKRLKELQQINESSNMKIMELKKDLAIMTEKSTLDQRSLKEKNHQINRLENSLTQVKHQCKEIDNLNRRLDVKMSQMNLKIKEHQRIKAETTHKVQKLYLTVRKLSKQLTIIKQDILFQINLQKPKLQSLILTIPDQILFREETLKQAHKQKIRELLNDLEEQRAQEHQEQDELIRENQNIKKEIKVLQQVMQDKEEDYLYNKERTVTVQVEKCRLIMQDEVNKEREERRKLQEKLYNQQKRFEYNISKSEKEVMKQVASFIAKWEHKLNHSQQLLLVKEKALKDLTNQLKKLTQQYEFTHQELSQKQQKLNKNQHKYQSLKQQRDKTIDELMKRLQKQTRHKLALEKQLKDIRGEIMKTQTNTNSSSPFNNYSFTDRENANIYTNAFQSTIGTQEKVKTHVKQSNREKQLSEIREMIAKTYKVVQTGAQKDEPVHKGRLF